MPRQRLINIRITRRRSFLQQRRARHDHPRLAIPALRHLRLKPGLLQRMRPVRRKPLNRPYLALAHSRNSRRARSLRHAVNMHGTSPAKRLPAPEFRPRKLQSIPQDPKQRRLRANIHGQNLSIHIQVVSRHPTPPKKAQSRQSDERDSTPAPSLTHMPFARFANPHKSKHKSRFEISQIV